MDGLERELSEALARRPAPPSLKHKVMERRSRERAQRRQQRMEWFERLAASLVLAGVAGGAVIGHYAVERRKGEEAKQQVFTALRIANHALEQMNAQLKQQDRNLR
jgi:cell division protein FtsB